MADLEAIVRGRSRFMRPLGYSIVGRDGVGDGLAQGAVRTVLA
jgi:hypothetical protein